MNSTFNFWHSSSKEQSVSWTNLAAMDRDYFPHPWQESDWLNLATIARNYLLIFDLSRGFCLWELDNFPNAYLLKILVLPTCRGQGVGDDLMNHSVDYLSKRHFVELGLEVACNNQSAISLYTRHGWQKQRLIKSFYSDGQDAISMSLLLQSDITKST